MKREANAGLTLAAAVLLAGWVSLPSNAWAQASETAAAEALFAKGRELVDIGDYAAACPKLEASLKLDPAIGTRLHLADCYERLGRTASAWATFLEVASLARIEGHAERESIAVARARALEPKLSRIEVRVAEGARIPELSIDVSGVAVPAASWGVALPFDPGTRVVRATAPGYRPLETKLELAQPGATTVVEITRLARLPPPSPRTSEKEPARRAVPPPARDTGRIQRITGIAVGAVGLGGVTAGVILGTQAILKNDASLEECRPDDPSLCSARGLDLRDSAFAYATGSTVALATGGAFVATGIVVFLTAPSSAAPKEMAITPMMGDGVAGVRWGGSW